jgi:exopolyphosphatase/guanosine-5'-triphosphate,3'-diphosphate pyrophosphatase
MKYFPDGVFTEQAFYRADIAAQAVLEEAISAYPRSQWKKAYGASGTVGAVAEILELAGFPHGEITLDGLDWLVKCLVRSGTASKVQLEGLKDDRRAVIGGGVSILRALMTILQVDTLHVAQGALRHGVLFEMAWP